MTKHQGGGTQGDWKPLGNRNRAPFVKWGDDKAMLVGLCREVWEGDYGLVARISVRECENLVGIRGKGDDQVRLVIQPGDTVNVGLNLAALKDISEKQVGQLIKIESRGWAEGKSGDKYRNIEVSVREEEAPNEEGGSSGGIADEPEGDDDVPF